MLSMLGVHRAIGYSSTEMATATVTVDGKIQRPPVIDYRLEDVPELGYFTTDKPYPRGEFLVKIPKFMAGYYKRLDLTAEKFTEDGFYRSGDVMALIGADEMAYVDRKNNVQKLSQGEFVAIARLEALYTQNPAIRQIYVYGSSARAFLLAVVVPADELLADVAKGGEAAEQVKAVIRRGLQQVAEEHGLASFWTTMRNRALPNENPEYALAPPKSLCSIRWPSAAAESLRHRQRSRPISVRSRALEAIWRAVTTLRQAT
jgi:fatty acid CoA ligase FadD9